MNLNPEMLPDDLIERKSHPQQRYVIQAYVGSQQDASHTEGEFLIGDVCPLPVL